MANLALSGDAGYTSVRRSQSDRSVNGVACDNLLAVEKRKTKKKKQRGRNKRVKEDLEPKDAAPRRAVAKVMLDRLGGEYHLGNDVVGDVVSAFEGDPDKLILKQLKEVYPAVNNHQLYDVLQSTNFDVRDAAAVVEAGLTPDPERAQRTVNSKVEQMSYRQTLLKNIHNASGETSISSTNQSQPASSTDKCPPNTPPKQKWAVVTSKESHPDKCDAERKKLLPQFKPCGDLDGYSCHRKSAEENWQRMNHFKREAAVARGRGQGSRARILAEKGRHYKQLAEQADERASQQIFHHRNKDFVDDLTIDLHALHVKEAIRFLKLHLRSLSSISSERTLKVITGYGSHSNAGQAKIKPAVIRFLTRSGIPWKELNIGCLIVKMSGACKELYNGDDISSI